MKHNVAGLIEEKELRALAGENGGSISAAIITAITALITVTLTADACPTSACTKSCQHQKAIA